MRPHLKDEAVVDLALGEGAQLERQHAAACESCGARVTEARASLDVARQAEVPEPSPLYWQALRSGVSRRIAEDRPEPRRIGFLVPLAAAAGLLAVALSLRPTPGPQPQPLAETRLPAWSALPLEEDDDGLVVLEGLALASGEVGEWQADGLEGYLASLSDEESRTLADGLRVQGGVS